MLCIVCQYKVAQEGSTWLHKVTQQKPILVHHTAYIHALRMGILQQLHGHQQVKHCKLADVGRLPLRCSMMVHQLPPIMPPIYLLSSGQISNL